MLAEHAEKIETLFKSGASYREIGDALGVSKQAIQYHLYRRGLSAIDGGNHVRKLLAAEGTRKKFMAAFGCSKEQWRQYIPLGLRRPFTQQRRNARLRGIPWNLSFGEFAAIWLLSGRWGQRGCSGEGFVMARFGDIGPYSWGNVEIISASENHSLSRARGPAKFAQREQSM